MQLLRVENERSLNSETLTIAYFDWKRVIAWSKGTRARIYGVISGKPFEHTSIVGGQTFRRIRNSRGTLHANVIMSSGLVITWEYIENRRWAQSLRSELRDNAGIKLWLYILLHAYRDKLRKEQKFINIIWSTSSLHINDTLNHFFF